jgi:transcriptional regulator GlxA family with amidase domain
MLTSQFVFYPTCTTATLPVELDYLVVGGPNPAAFTPDPTHVEFIRKHVAAGKTLFTTCTGSYVVACSGVLDGREATINNQEFYWVKERFPNVMWRKDKKWVVDEGKNGQGTIWTGSGAVAGIDMIASWIKQEFGVEVLMQGAAGLDYEPRDIDGFANEVFPKRLQEGTGRVMGAHVYP